MTTMARWVVFALRNLSRQPRRTALCALTVAFSVVGLVVQAGFSRGIIGYLERVVALGTMGEIQVHRQGYLKAVAATPISLAFDDTEALRAKIAGVPGVKALAPRLVFSGLVSQGRTQTMVVVRSVDPALEPAVCPNWLVSVTPPEGAVFADRGTVLGKELLEGLDVPLGQLVTVSGENGRGRANALTLPVNGVVSAGMPIENKRVGMMSLDAAQELLDMKGRVTEYGVAVTSDASAVEVTRALRLALGPEYEAHTWREIVPLWRDGLEYISAMWVMSAVLLALVAIAGITAALTMNVLERTREIGAMLAMGIRRRGILALFLWETAFLGGVAAFLGAGVSVCVVMAMGLVGIPSAALGMEDHQMIRPSLDVPLTIAAILGAVAVTVVAGLVPARRAAKLRPVEALMGR